jgi:hypothetical protein
MAQLQFLWRKKKKKKIHLEDGKVTETASRKTNLKFRLQANEKKY